MNSGGASFQYDPFGRRVGNTVLGATTNYAYDGVNPVQESSGGTVTANLLTGGVVMRLVNFRTSAAWPQLLLALSQGRDSEKSSQFLRRNR